MTPFFRSKYAFFSAILFGVAVTIMHTGCGVRKIIPENEHLLKKNTVLVITNDKDIGEVNAQILHRTNKRVLFNRLPIFLWIYALGTNNKNPELSDSVGWRRKFRRELGEEPVFFNPQLARISADNIKYYLFNQGYFDATCTYSVSFSKRKARVKYLADAETRYKISEITYSAPDSALNDLLKKSVTGMPQFRMWWPCNLNRFQDAQEKLSSVFRDSGYYSVSAQLFHYEIDTNQIRKEAKVKIVLDPPGSQKTHKKFIIDKVNVTINTSTQYLQNNKPKFASFPGIDITLNQYPFNPSILNQVITIDSGDHFSQTRWTESYRRLIDLGIFSQVDIQQNIDTQTFRISPNITLKTAPRMRLEAEPQFLYSPQGSSGLNFQTSTQRSFGLAGILSFSNRNTFGNGEYFKLSSITSYEAIFKRNDITDLFTGLQQAVVASLKLPRFGFISKVKGLNEYEQQNTLLNISYQYEQNPNFTRSSLPASLSLQFLKNKLSWYYTPFEISFNRNQISAEFLPQLPKLDQEFVRRVFTDQIITPTKLGMVYSNNTKKPGQTSTFLRLGIETSGNWHRLYRYLFEENHRPDSSYKLLGVNYFQYTKLEAELRLKQNIDELNSVAMKVNWGMAIPYWNSNLVPYDKRYFIGGSNSLRAWKPRGLGPGNTPRSTSTLIDRSGEFLLEASIEYRFTLIRKLLETALFMDAGNIWNLSKQSSSNPTYGVLNRQTFLSEIALNTGIGLRWDLSVFMFRMDWGIPLRDPSLALNQRWILSESINNRNFGSFLLNETAVAIGIGYPF
jgi:outer membrane protein assembly factor BamA